MIVAVLRKRPWLWVVFAFVLLITGWLVFFKVVLSAPMPRVEFGEPLPEGIVPGSGHPAAQERAREENDD